MDAKENRYQNLLKLLKQMKARELAEIAGTNASYISQIKTRKKLKSGKTRQVGDDLASAIEKGLRKPRGWMDRDHDQVPINTWQKHPAVQEIINQENEASTHKVSESAGTYNTPLQHDQARALMRIPIVGHTQGGPDVEWVELGYPTGWGEEFFELLCPDANAYGLIVRGNSMHPKYSEGEAICVAPNIDAGPGDCVVLKQTDGTVMLKVFASCNNKRYVFESINNGHGPLVVHEDEIEFIHYVYAGLPRSAIRHV